MSARFATTPLGLDYARRFTAAYREGSKHGVCRREILCEDVQFPTVLVAPRASDLLAGKRIYPEVGYSVQYGGLGFYADIGSPESGNADEWEELREFWEHENTTARAIRNLEPEVRARLPHSFSGNNGHLIHPAYALYRMAGLQLDYGKLVEHGIPGLEEMLGTSLNVAPDSQAREFYESALASVHRLRRCVEHYLEETMQLPQGAASAMRQALTCLLDHAPRTFHEGLQLVLLVSTITGTINFGRLDVVLGPLLCRDLDRESLTHADALALMQSFFTILEEEILHFDGRITVGGMGRANEATADRFALLAMETTESLSLPMPQLTLRFYDGQNPALLDKAYDVIAKGKTFPMLYNDDVNVPAVAKAFGIDEETARQYLPFGCGETMIDHQSCGTPNAIINLQLCLESAMNHGCSLQSERVIGPDFGCIRDYPTFEALWDAYTRTVEFYLEPLAIAQESIYRSVGRECPFSLVSLLYDDCLARGRPIFDGGIRYLGGTNETYGNNNAADSLTAIRKLVYTDKTCPASELLVALQNDWNGHELLRRRFKEAPKFGNDDEVADAMVRRVHEHVCRATSAASVSSTLHHFLVVVINNNHNTIWGECTSASADGRHHGDPLAPGNAPGAGCDRNGLTALLNSQAKPDPAILAGAVQNVKLSASFPQQHRPLYHALFNTYFKNGGTQTMISVTNRHDLLDALKHPENHANLLVRVGGFSARFVELDSATQKEILSRTEHAA
jgi:pyruvate-formate lyase